MTRETPASFDSGKSSSTPVLRAGSSCLSQWSPSRRRVVSPTIDLAGGPGFHGNGILVRRAMWGVGNLFGRTGGDERMAGTLVRDNRGTASPARAEREEGRAIDKDGETGPDGSPYARSGRTDRNRHRAGRDGPSGCARHRRWHPRGGTPAEDRQAGFRQRQVVDRVIRAPRRIVERVERWGR